jgi:hypothetical protein
MQNIGKLFTSSNKQIDGPVLLHSYPDRNIYLLGEHHRINGNGKNDHIWSIIKQYALTYPKKEVKLFMEAVPGDVYFIRDNCNSPLSTAIKDLLKGNSYSNIKPFFINIRRASPLSILEVIYDKPTFAALNIKDASVFEFHNNAKSFEKDFFTHVKSRKSCTDFFISILTPDGKYPDWFKEYLDIFKLSHTENPLKDVLAKLKNDDPLFYKAILNIIGNMFNYVVESNTEYSHAMVSAERTRNSKSSNMVAEKYPQYMTFWIAVCSIFMDVYIMCMMKLHPASDDVFIVMAGYNHIHNIVKHMPKMSMEERQVSLFNKAGIISHNSNLPPLHLSESPSTLLSQFRDARRNKHLD